MAEPIDIEAIERAWEARLSELHATAESLGWLLQDFSDQGMPPEAIALRAACLQENIDRAMNALHWTKPIYLKLTPEQEAVARRLIGEPSQTAHSTEDACES